MRIYYICAECGGIAGIEEEALDTGTTFTCNHCGKDTVIVLMTGKQYTVKSEKLLAEVERLHAAEHDHPVHELEIMNDLARHLRRAVNSHEELVGALKGVVAWFDDIPWGSPLKPTSLNIAPVKDAIRKAERR